MGAIFVFRQHDAVAVCPKGSKDAANEGKQATKIGNINQTTSSNLTYNLVRFTLIEDTDDLERIGRTHMLIQTKIRQTLLSLM